MANANVASGRRLHEVVRSDDGDPRPKPVPAETDLGRMFFSLCGSGFPSEVTPLRRCDAELLLEHLHRARGAGAWDASACVRVRASVLERMQQSACVNAGFVDDLVGILRRGGTNAVACRMAAMVTDPLDAFTRELRESYRARGAKLSDGRLHYLRAAFVCAIYDLRGDPAPTAVRPVACPPLPMSSAPVYPRR